MVGLTDLDGSQSHVQDVQAGYMNDLIDIGVTGKFGLKCKNTQSPDHVIPQIDVALGFIQHFQHCKTNNHESKWLF